MGIKVEWSTNPIGWPVKDGADEAVKMLEDGSLCAVMVVGVHPDGHGFKLWEAGDSEVTDRVRVALLDAVPVKSVKT